MDNKPELENRLFASLQNETPRLSVNPISLMLLDTQNALGPQHSATRALIEDSSPDLGSAKQQLPLPDMRQDTPVVWLI